MELLREYSYGSVGLSTLARTEHKEQKPACVRRSTVVDMSLTLTSPRSPCRAAEGLGMDAWIPKRSMRLYTIYTSLEGVTIS